MKSILDKLSSSCRTGLVEYSNNYMKYLHDIYPSIVNPRLLKSHIKTNDLISGESLLRFSLVFNDLSLFTPIGGKELAVIMLQPKWFEDKFGVSGATVVLSEQKLKELNIDSINPEICPSFIFPKGGDIENMVKNLHPFIKSGRLLIQPERALFHVAGENKSGGRIIQHIDVSQYSSLDSWEIVDESSSRPIPIKYSSSNTFNQQSLFEITIPYLEGVSFSDLAKILEDESDLLSGLRLSIKKAVSENDGKNDPDTIARDLIDPKIDAINRRFRSLVNTHSFRVGGAAVGTVILAYTSVASIGLASTVATVCGSGGLGLLCKEYSDYRGQLNEIKADPFYFLWKCKRASRT